MTTTQPKRPETNHFPDWVRYADELEMEIQKLKTSAYSRGDQEEREQQWGKQPGYPR